jgi:hypothetical protein
MKKFLTTVWLLASILMLFGANSIIAAIIAVTSLGASVIVAQRIELFK